MRSVRKRGRSPLGVPFVRAKGTKTRQRRGLPPPCGIHPAFLGCQELLPNPGRRAVPMPRENDALPHPVAARVVLLFSWFRPYLWCIPAHRGRAAAPAPRLESLVGCRFLAAELQGIGGWQQPLPPEKGPDRETAQALGPAAMLTWRGGTSRNSRSPSGPWTWDAVPAWYLKKGGT